MTHHCACAYLIVFVDSPPAIAQLCGHPCFYWIQNCIGRHPDLPRVCLLPHAHVQGVKQSVCLSVVVVIGTKIARSRVLGICACCKHNQSVDIGEKLVCTRFELLKKAYWCYKSCISVQHACGLSTTPIFSIKVC